jgi:hypothetical protein
MDCTIGTAVVRRSVPSPRATTLAVIIFRERAQSFYSETGATTAIWFPSRNRYRAYLESRGEQIGRRTPVDLGLAGNVKDTLAVLMPMLNYKQP